MAISDKDLAAKVAKLEKALELADRENEALRKAVDQRIAHGATRLALENAEKRAELKAAARKEGKGEKEVALYVVRGDPFFNHKTLTLHQAGTVVRLSVDEDPSIYWAPVVAKLPSGAYVAGDDAGEDENDAGPDEDVVARAKGTAGAKAATTGVMAPLPPAPSRPSDKQVA